MRKILLFILFLPLACADGGPLQPTDRLAVNPEQPPPKTSADTDLLKKVPLKGKGVLNIVGQAPGCGGDAELISATVEIRMRLTHLGRSTITTTNCFTSPAFVYVFGEGTITAANGDQVFYRGSAVYYGTTHPFYPDGRWEFGPLHIVGGSGRFEGAVGVFHGWGMMDESGMAGTAFTEGWISSVGSIK
jgi:hypothetical protein